MTDLHLTNDYPTTAEIDAVDAVLTIDQRATISHGERVVEGGRARKRGLRHLLLPALHALQSEVGWISPGGLNHISERLGVPPAEAYGVASFYHLFELDASHDAVAHVCDDVACRIAGGNELIDELRAAGVEVEPSPCLGQCERAPVVLCQRAGEQDATIADATASEVGVVLASSGDPVTDHDPAKTVPQLGDPGLRLLRRVGVVDPTSLDSYRHHGGYQSLRRAIDLGPAGVIDEIKRSGLLGRGGAAFPTGVKWDAVSSQPVRTRHLVCNADESEPGTFKDRVVMEHDPFALIEAMTIAGFAVGAEQGWLYIRGEYPEATRRLRAAIDAARDRGLLGPDVAGAGFSFDIELRSGAGAYICGEETALFNSLEGFRGEPRNKPPYPTVHGLFGQPTVVNNVETLVNVLDIVAGGGDAYAEIGPGGSSTGTKLFCISGRVAAPGLYEVPFGATLGELIELAGGVVGELRAVLLGGAAGSFAGPDKLDVPLTFEGAREHGVALGSGVIFVLDQDVDSAGVVARIAQFFRDESCGQCVPCRVGTVRQHEALVRIGSGKPVAPEQHLIDELAMVMADASICGLGHTASGAVRSAIDLGLIGSTTSSNGRSEAQ